VLLVQLLEDCTEKLGFHKAARRLFLDNGQEVLSEEDLDRDVEVYVSTGEPFKNPVKDMLRMYVVFSDHLVIAHFNIVRLVHVTWRIGQQRPSCLQRDWSAVPPRCHQHVPNPSGMFSSMFPSAVLSLTLFLLHQAIAVLAGQSLGRYVQTSLISILL